MSADPVVEAHDLSKLANLLLIDARDAASRALEPQPGAVHAPVEKWVEAAKDQTTSLAAVSYWQAELEKLGVTDKSLVVVYDDGRMTEAARVWFILQYFGVNARLLNGGWPSLKLLAGTLQLPAPAAGGRFIAKPASGDVGLIERAALRASLEHVTVFDARTRAEHAGDDLRQNARGGHMPGARLLPHGDLLDGDLLDGKLMRSPGELREMIEGAGFEPGDHLVTHCDGGGRAALAALAAKRAGFDNVRVYYLSFSDWARDESCPIIRPNDGA